MQIKTLSKSEATLAFLAGEQVIVVEYRGSKVDHVQWRDKQSQRAMSGDFLRHTVESNSASFPVDQRLAEGETAQAVIAELEKAGLKKGDKCILRYTQLTSAKGRVEAKGVLEVFTKEVSPK